MSAVFMRLVGLPAASTAGKSTGGERSLVEGE